MKSITNILKLLILAVIFLPFQNYYSQMIKNELNIKNEEFKEVKIENAGNVFFSKGSNNSIIIEKDPNSKKNIDFIIANGRAYITQLNTDGVNTKGNYNIYITSVSDDISINALNIGALKTTDKAVFKTINLQLINCGQIDLLVESKSLFCNFQNVFRYAIAGSTDKFSLEKKNITSGNIRKLKIRNQ